MIHCQIVLVRTSMIQTYKRKMTCNKPRTNQESERKKKRLMYPGVFSSGIQIIEEFANDIEIHLTSKTRIVIKCLFNVKGFLYISPVRVTYIFLIFFSILLQSLDEREEQASVFFSCSCFCSALVSLRCCFWDQTPICWGNSRRYCLHRESLIYKICMRSWILVSGVSYLLREWWTLDCEVFCGRNCLFFETSLFHCKWYVLVGRSMFSPIYTLWSLKSTYM